MLAKLRERWTPQRIALVATGLVGYHLVYLGYRNMKSWNAFNPLRDDDLLDFDKALFLGHSPAELLHGLFGEAGAADFFSVVYRSFTYVIVLSLIGTLALIPSVRKAYVFLCAATYAWILGTISYYVLPSLGPYATAPWEFAGLRATQITDTQAEYLTERAHFLANSVGARDAFVSLGAFASLHVGLLDAGLPDGALLRPQAHLARDGCLPRRWWSSRPSTSAGTTSATTSPARCSRPPPCCSATGPCRRRSADRRASPG